MEKQAKKEFNAVSDTTSAPVNIRALCMNELDYDRYAPTKQNLLCDGKSALETILSHQDFVNKPFAGNGSFQLGIEASPPKFKYLLHRPNLRIVLALDISQQMNHEDRWARTRDALFRLVSHIPTGAEMGIVTFGDELQYGAKVNILPTVVRESNREGLHGRIPYRLLHDGEACLECGLKKASEILSSEKGGGSIVVVSGNRGKLSDFGAKKLAESGHSIHHVFFEDGYDDDARPFESSVYKVSSTPRLLQSLSSVFLSILKKANGPKIECTFQRYFHFEDLPNEAIFDSNDHELVHSGNHLQGTFTVEKELSRDLWVVLTPNPGFEEDIEVFEITSPSGRKHVFPKYDHGIVYFHFEAQSNEAGVWSFNARLHPIVTRTSGSMVALEVFGQQSANGNAVTLDFWTAPSNSVGSGPTVTTILYARLTQDLLPIQDANVQAFISVSDEPEVIKVTLKDEGSGYPDITRGDGIYSAYITHLSKGFMSVQVQADYNHGRANLPKPYGVDVSEGVACCGSKLPDFYTIPTSPFERIITGQSFANPGGMDSMDDGGFESISNNGLAVVQENRDIFPPSRITDLRLKSYANNSLKLTLQWTSPGDDFNIGRAFRYEMRCYTNPEALISSQFLDNVAIPVHESELPAPEEAGQTQEVTVSVPWSNEVFYYAIQALDDHNNRGQVSNLVPVYIEEIKTTTRMDLVFRVVNSTSSTNGQSEAYELIDNDTMIYVISGGITAFLLVLIFTFTLAMCRAKRKRQLKERPPPPMSETNRHQSEANIYVVNSNGSQLGSIVEHHPTTSGSVTTTSILPDVTGNIDSNHKGVNVNNQTGSGIDVWKMDNLMDNGYINTYFRGSGNPHNITTGSHGGYPSLQAFPTSTSPHNVGPMSLLSLNISHNPKAQMTNSQSQTNLSALNPAQLQLQVFRNRPDSSETATGSTRDESSPTYQNWSQHSKELTINGEVVSNLKNKTSNSASDCTSSTECNSSEDSADDRNLEEANNNNNSKDPVSGKATATVAPTPAPRMTKGSTGSSIRSISVERVKQVRHESLV